MDTCDQKIIDIRLKVGIGPVVLVNGVFQNFSIYTYYLSFFSFFIMLICCNRVCKKTKTVRTLENWLKNQTNVAVSGLDWLGGLNISNNNGIISKSYSSGGLGTPYPTRTYDFIADRSCLVYNSLIIFVNYCCL